MPHRLFAKVFLLWLFAYSIYFVIFFTNNIAQIWSWMKITYHFSYVYLCAGILHTKVARLFNIMQFSFQITVSLFKAIWMFSEKPDQKYWLIFFPSVLHLSALGPLPNCTNATKTFRWIFDLGCINIIICCLIPHFALLVLVHLRSTPCAVVVRHLRSTGLEVLSPL